MKLGLDLENCYGINKLAKELDFARIDSIDGVCSLYAPNGTLKTSLAKTLKDIEEDRQSKDIIFPERATKRLVTLNDQPVTADQIDDIADSFDYKNKYAIVEYLRDIAQVSHFYLFILTHNFDFHRIVGGRIIGSRNRVARQRRMLATKTSTEIKLNPEKYQNDVFVAWKRDMHQNEHYMLASIPFVRNLAEYCGHDAHYLTLTSLLHLKADSQNITVQELQGIYRAVLVDKPALILPDSTSRVIDKIFQKADLLSNAAHESPELESKVIVAMAIRLKAEQFMIAQINDQAFVDGIESNQTRELFDKYVETHFGETEKVRLLDQVNLMTPENIHLNSFMYEPILDMSAHRLYSLYNEVKQLGN